MNRDNPFGNPDDIDATIRRPRPGGVKGAGAPTSSAAAAAAPAQPPRITAIGDDAETAFFSAAALNPVVGLASPLLWLTSRLSDSQEPDDVGALLDRVMEELRRFEIEAFAKGLYPETVRLARYVLCATLDDVVMNTDWGSQSVWTTRGLVSTLYNETLGGERFFEIQDRLMTDANANADLLELIAICIGLGFCGKYRVMPGGLPQLAKLRDDLHRTLRRVRGGFEPDLSPHWRGLDSPYKPLASPRLVWIVAGIAFLLLLVLYGVFSLTLRAQSDVLIGRLQTLIPAEPPPPPLPAKPAPTQLQRCQAALAPDIQAGTLQVVGEPKRIIIRIIGRALFDSGKDQVHPSVQPALERIGRFLDGEPGPIEVVGHADNQPARPPLNNEELSLARADSVSKALATRLKAPSRLTAEGRGSAEPVASNATAAGREQNRRVDIVFERTDPAP